MGPGGVHQADVQPGRHDLRCVCCVSKLQALGVKIGSNDEIPRGQRCLSDAGTNATGASGNKPDLAHSGMSSSIQARADV